MLKERLDKEFLRVDNHCKPAEYPAYSYPTCSQPARSFQQDRVLKGSHLARLTTHIAHQKIGRLFLSYMAVRSSSQWLYARRTTGGDRHHWHLNWAIAAGDSSRPRVGA